MGMYLLEERYLSDLGRGRGGADDEELGIERILNQRREMLPHKTRAFVLRWEGEMIPRGACVLGREIAWTSGGVVMAHPRDLGAKRDEPIGFYEAIQSGDEVGHRRRVLVLFIPPSSLAS